MMGERLWWTRILEGHHSTHIVPQGKGRRRSLVSTKHTSSHACFYLRLYFIICSNVCVYVYSCVCMHMCVYACEGQRTTSGAIDLVPFPPHFFFERASKISEKHCLNTKCPLCCMQLVNGDEGFWGWKQQDARWL